MEFLFFKYHQDQAVVRYGDHAQADWVQRDAEWGHALHVFDPLRDAIWKAVQIVEQLKSKEARYYMQFGAGRRLNMMWHSYRSLIFTAPPNRTDPLSDKEGSELNKDINLIYMNLRGVLDNFALAYIHEKEPSLAKLNKREIDLFSSKIRRNSNNHALWKQIDKHAGWNQEIKNRRDPVAHRIPLHIPGTVLCREEAEQYKKYQELHFSEGLKGNQNDSEQAWENMHKLGTFFPALTHHPDEGTTPLYPTVPEDMAHVVAIHEIIAKSLE